MDGQKPLGRAAGALEWSQQQWMTSTCGICGESVQARVPDAVAWFADHRARKHPELPEPAPRRGRERTKPAPA
jgi:hypothetical protein